MGGLKVNNFAVSYVQYQDNKIEVYLVFQLDLSLEVENKTVKFFFYQLL